MHFSNKYPSKSVILRAHDKMEPIIEDHLIDRSRETSPDHLLQLKFSGENNIYEDPSVYPRIGDLYQVKLPTLEVKLDALHSTQRSLVAGVGEVEYSDKIGLPIPVSWIPTKGNGTREESEGISCERENSDKVVIAVLEKGRKTQNSDSSTDELHTAENLKCAVSNTEQNAEVSNKTANGKPCERLESLDSPLSDVHIDVKQKTCKCYSAVPDSWSTTWSDAEAENFLLGLYIFGKNLVCVRNFMESKKMGDVLAFYYGAFYKSSAHRRWSECRKSKSKRCAHGQRIFSGWRQHELLSRLLPGISPEKQNTLLQVTKNFNEGDCSFEDYVSTLKDAVGVQALVEAVGIGKGKRDLTNIALDHVKGNQVLSVHSEIPLGKACSALTSGEIIKFLTGNFRLSKTRSNDLFWEAVWPRLLAKGWHSEQPKDQIGAAAKNNLVFLIPGAKKFSSKLVKGEHYFDSVSDVLNIVASDPMLLILEVEGDKVNYEIKEGDGCTDAVLDQNGSAYESRPCYQHARFPDCNAGLMKFTVVDTSLFEGEEPFKVRELRSLPIDTSHSYIPSSSDGIEVNSSSGHPESGDASLPEEEESDLVTSDNRHTRNNLKRTANKKLQGDHPPIPKKKEIHKQDANGQGKGNLSGETSKNMKNQFSHKGKSGKPNYLSPVSKRPKLSACDFSEIGYCVLSSPRGHQMKKEMSYQLKSPDAIDTMVSNLGIDCKNGKDNNYTDPGCHNPSFTGQSHLKKEKDLQVRSLNAIETIDVKLDMDNSWNGSSKGKTVTRFPGEGGPASKSSPNEGGVCIFGDSSVGHGSVDMMVSPVGKSGQRALIDLNVPQFPPEFDATNLFGAETTESQDTLHMSGTSQSETLLHQDDSRSHEASSEVPSIQQQQSKSERRQSTRSRPLTTKALEALASGYSNMKRRGRSSNVASKSSRSARKKAESSLPFVSAGNNKVTSEITSSRTLQADEVSNYYENGRNFLSKVSAEPENRHLACDFLRIS